MIAQLAENVALDGARAWTLLRELAQRAREGRPLAGTRGIRLDAQGGWDEVAPELGSFSVVEGAEPCFSAPWALPLDVTRLFQLYLPLCLGERAQDLVIAHLGQSLDGQVAISSGASRYLTGPENVTHVHRLRALCDAVIVGAETVERDDPELTTRLVPGDSPVRVVIDPELRVASTRRVLTDGSRTLVVCARGAGARALSRTVDLLEVPCEGGVLSPREVTRALAAVGLRRLFVEGGGITVSRFLAAGAVHRLHVTVAPLLIGTGRPGLQLPPIERLEHAMRPKTRRFDLGVDVLFDCEIDVGHTAAPSPL